MTARPIWIPLAATLAIALFGAWLDWAAFLRTWLGALERLEGQP